MEMVPPNALCRAAESGDLDLINRLRSAGYVPDESILSTAAAHGRLSVVKHLLSLGLTPTRSVLIGAAASGVIELFQLVVSTYDQRRLPYDVYIEAVKSRRLEFLEWLLEHYPITNDVNVVANVPGTAMDYALGLDLPKAVELLRTYYSDQPTPTAAQIAAEYGVVRVVKYLDERYGYYEVDPDHAASEGHLDVLRYHHCKGHLINGNELYQAARHERWPVVQWMLSELPLTHDDLVDGLTGALYSGNLELIHTLQPRVNLDSIDQHDADQLTRASINGAGRYALFILGVLRERRLLNVDLTRHHAIVNGRVDVLEWLQLDNLRVSNNELAEVLANGRLTMLTYLNELGVQLPADAMDIAFAHDQLLVVQFLLNQGHVIDRWYQCSSLELIKLLYQQLGLPDERYVNQLIDERNLSALVYLGDHGLWFTSSHIDKATGSQQFELVKYLRRHVVD